MSSRWNLSSARRFCCKSKSIRGIDEGKDCEEVGSNGVQQTLVKGHRVVSKPQAIRERAVRQRGTYLYGRLSD